MQFREIINDRYQNYRTDSLISNPFQDKCKTARPIFVPIFYVGGVVGYSLSLISRVFRIIKEICLLIVDTVIYLINSSDDNLDIIKKRMVVVGLAFIQLGVAVVGILCPIISYEADKYIQSFNVFNCSNLFPYQEPGAIWSNKNNLQHTN